MGNKVEMNAVMVVLIVITGVVFLTIGILFLFRRSIFSPIGYTNLPEDEKTISYKGSIIFCGTIFTFLGLSVIIAVLFDFIGIVGILIGLTIVLTVFSLVYLYVKITSKNRKHEDDSNML